MGIERTAWGEHGGRPVHLFGLDDGCGTTVDVSTYGAIVTAFRVPGARGEPIDVALGFDSLDAYVRANGYFGAMVGRVANRIARGRFTLDGTTYSLATNDGANHLHGGRRGFDKVVWRADASDAPDGPEVRLAHSSPAGDEGYPGRVDVVVTIGLKGPGELAIGVEATADAPTPLSVVHHGFFNLDGHGAGAILDHVLELRASRYTPSAADLVPTGAIAPVRGTPYDFTRPKRIGAAIDALRAFDDPAESFDTNYVIDGHANASGGLVHAARLASPRSAFTMDVLTTLPGLQLYAGHFLRGVRGKGGAVYGKHAGLCLEAQHFPDAVNKRGLAGWPDPVLRPGETHRHATVHRVACAAGAR